jgi:restriction endonuclease S subunit
MSERFFQFAVETSAGSLSPRTNWSQLMQFEFALPPLDQQRRIAEILWAVDESIETASANLNLLSSLKQAAMEEYTLFGKSVESHGAEAPAYPVRRLGDVATTCQYGLSCPLSEGGRYPILRMMNYDEELVAATELNNADMPAGVAAVFKVQKGDILFNRTNSADVVGKVGIVDLDGCYLFASYLVRVQTNRSLLQPEFLNYYLSSRHGPIAVRAFATPAVSQSNISAGNLKKVNVPVSSIRDQETVVSKLKEIASAYRTARAHVATQHAMILTFVSAIVGGQP